ncbi:MAG: hypothetical protein WC121_04430 [Candidatus Kapaibacterium sp.]
MRIHNKVGGGANANLNGLEFEGRTHLLEALNKHPHFTVEQNKVYKNNKLVAEYYEKHGLYKQLLIPNCIDYKKIISRKLLPDGVLLVKDKIYIIEKKYQAGSGSVDEKLQTCDFKKKQYIKLFAQLEISSVEYYYVLNNWFQNPRNKDVFDYIESVSCRYFIDEIPLEELGLE